MKRLVNVDTFLGLLSRRSSQTLLFRTSEIDKLQLGDSYVDGLTNVLRLNRKAENRVRARRKIVQIMARQDTVSGSVLVQIQHFL